MVVVLAIVLFTVVLHAAGATRGMSYWWGAHFYSFFPPAVSFVAIVVLLAAVVVVTAWRSSGPERKGTRFPRGALGLSVAVGGLSATAVVLWLARTRNTYLGDGNVLGNSLVDWSGVHPREPLTMWIHHSLYRAAAATGAASGRAPEAVAAGAVALGSAAAGVLFTAVAWFLAKELSRTREDDDDPPVGIVVLVWLALVTQGYAQLFFGYVENYTYYALGIAVYLLAALRYLRGSSPLIAAAAALVLALLLHVSAAVLAPSFVVLVVWGVLRERRRAAALRDLGLGAFLLAVAFVVLGRLQAGYDLFGAVAGGAENLRALGGADMRGYLLSKKHAFDFINEQLLIGPLGMWLFLPALVLLPISERARTARGFFLAVAGVFYLAVGWMAGDSNLGYARNWDLLAPAGLVFTAAGIGLFVADSVSSRWKTPVLASAVLVSLFHTAPWIATNASEVRSFARLETLPLGMGRTEVLVGTWYMKRGQRELAHEWLERAVAANPQNNNAYYLLGADYLQSGDMARAAESLGRAVELRPDKVRFHRMLVQSLFGCGRVEEAIPHIEFILDRGSGTGADWALYGEALKAAGRGEDAQAAFRRALPLMREEQTRSPQSFASNLGLAQVLYNLNEYEEALEYFQRALSANPDSDSALALAGYTLRRLGRNAESNEYFRRCLAVNPDYPDREEMKGWLGE